MPQNHTTLPHTEPSAPVSVSVLTVGAVGASLLPLPLRRRSLHCKEEEDYGKLQTKEAEDCEMIPMTEAEVGPSYTRQHSGELREEKKTELLCLWWTTW